ncbi:protein singed wings 2-like [Tropilaelaps mercedesae]|uniref:Protein singed wings 2-like n=1 Tax=Tropilaelaps mercedesae TaxID=418985 RepID=A0A1V9WZ66_9ACAR|nr:protein singed wings 2-like [Tropilaelaps mercedesae]
MAGILRSPAPRAAVAPVDMAMIFLMLAALCGRTIEVSRSIDPQFPANAIDVSLLVRIETQRCVKFSPEIVTKREDSLLLRPDGRLINHLELELRDCYLNGPLQPAELNSSLSIGLVSMKMYNVTISAAVDWKFVLPFTLNGTLLIRDCHFEDEGKLESLTLFHVSELIVVRSGLRRLPHFDLSGGCAMKKANLSHNDIEDVPDAAFNNIFLNCSVLTDFDVTDNAISGFQQNRCLCILSRNNE